VVSIEGGGGAAVWGKDREVRLLKLWGFLRGVSRQMLPENLKVGWSRGMKGGRVAYGKM